jgi:hypothetical protein
MSPEIFSFIRSTRSSSNASISVMIFSRIASASAGGSFFPNPPPPTWRGGGGGVGVSEGAEEEPEIQPVPGSQESFDDVEGVDGVCGCEEEGSDGLGWADEALSWASMTAAVRIRSE